MSSRPISAFFRPLCPAPAGGAAASGGTLTDEQKARIAANKAAAEVSTHFLRAPARSRALTRASHPRQAKRGASSADADDDAPSKKARTEELAVAAPIAAAPTVALPAVPASWAAALAPELSKPYFRTLRAFLAGEAAKRAVVFPPTAEIFAALELSPLEQTKVVIVGQDPYHAPGQAHGLAFSVRRPVPPPPSLKNIYKEAEADLGAGAADGAAAPWRRPSHGDLTAWASRGVLLLNTTLTVRRGEANSHAKKGWEQFTDAVIRVLDKRAGQGLVFVLWGKPASAKCAAIDARRHRVIRSSHPSPLGATKTAEPFIGSRCFSRANAALVELGHEPIDWSL